MVWQYADIVSLTATVTMSNDETNPTVLKYAIQLYQYLDERAEVNQYHEHVFTGRVGEAYKAIGASSTYHSDIRKLLIESGSVTVLQRGTGKQASEWVLNGLDENILVVPLTPPEPGATMGVQVDRRLAALESWRETTGGINIAEALRNMESRLTKLEGQVYGKSGTGGKD